MKSIFFLLLHISVILLFVISLYLLRIKGKKQIHKVFICTLISMLIWSVGYLLDAYSREFFNLSVTVFIYIWFFGVCFTPVFLLLTGIIFAKTRISFGYKHLLLFAVPILSLLVLVTNQYHNLFFIRFSSNNSDVIYGDYFIIHSIYSYACIIIGLGYMIYYSIKNSGFFSKQSILIVIGSSIPLLVNFITITKLIKVEFYITAISFSAAVIIFTIAIFRFNFLSVAPIALQTVVDKISDSFLVINEEYQIIDYNEPMIKTFKDIVQIKRNMDLSNLLEKISCLKSDDHFIQTIYNAQNLGGSVSYKKNIKENNFDKHFKIEITPIISKGNYLGTVILFKDITENIRHIAAIEEKHAIMMEQERLASLGQLIGGIAHNLKTSIMSIAGAVEGLRDLVEEYEISVGDSCVTVEDHLEIADEMRTWLDKIKPYCSYMTDVINTVKGQTMQYSDTSMLSFTVNELVKRIELLLKYELIRYNCKLNTEVLVDIDTELYGDINSLVQIFDNIIINAIQAYEGKKGQIDFNICESDGYILFSVKDYAKGIDPSIKDKLLKEMVTTKGKDGTGLGLYMSYSTIKGRFEGNMWFESEEGKGTTFFIQLPHNQKINLLS